MEDPAVTVVIPLYNGARFIEAALTSALTQTLPPAWINVVDDGSTDEGPEIVARLAARHNVTLIRKPNGGQASARNLGIAQAATPLIALLDQDDIWYPNHLSELIGPFRSVSYPELGWVYSNLDEIDRDGRMVTRSCLDQKPEVEHPKRSLVGCLTTDMFILPTSCLIRRAAFQSVGGFDERLTGYEDDDLFLRMFRQGYDNVYVNKALAQWRIFPESASHSPRMGRSRMIYFRKLVDMFPLTEPRNAGYVRELIAPRFCPWLLLEYRRALESGDAAMRTTTLEDLTFLAAYLPRRSRIVFRGFWPALTWPPTARIAGSLVTFVLKVANLRPVTTLLRRLLGLAPAGRYGQRPGAGR